MGLFNLFSSRSASSSTEFYSTKNTLELMMRPHLDCNYLPDQVADLYSEYASFLTSIITCAILNTSYKAAKSLSDDDKFMNSISKTTLEECIKFQEKYLLQGKIIKDDAFGSVNFERLKDRRELYAFLLIKTNEYSKEIKALATSGISTIEFYPSFLKDIYCVRVEETSRGIKIMDEEEYNIEWEGPATFLSDVILEYKAQFNKYKR